MARRPRPVDLTRVNRAAAVVEFPEAIWKTSPWQPRAIVETGLRQWMRCCGAALRDGQIIGMPSHAVDEAWHGFILCTQRYAAFCDEAYGRFLHHHPDGSGSGAADTVAAQLGRTVVAWSLVAAPGEQCMLWDADRRVGVEHPWGVPEEQVAAVTAELMARR